MWLILSIIWGSTWLFIKLALDDGLPPFSLMYTRFLVAGLFLSLIGLSRLKHLPSWQDLKLIAFTGNIIFTLNYALVYWGETRISSGLAAIIYTTLPLFGTLISHKMLPDEPLSRAKLGGSIMGLIGVAIIFGNQLNLEGTFAMWGVVAIFLAVFVTAVASALVKLHCRHIDPVIFTGGQILTSLPLMVGGSLLLEGSPLNYNWTQMALLSVLYLGVVGTAVTFTLINWLYRHMELSKTQFIPFFSTLIAVLLGWLVRGEVLQWRTAGGTVLILSGLFLALRQKA